MTFDVEIVLRDRNYAVTEQLTQPGDPAQWTEREVEAVLKEILLSIDRAKNPAATDRHVALRGFSWIVEPADGGVVIAIEIPTGAAVAGPFANPTGQPRSADHQRPRSPTRPKPVDPLAGFSFPLQYRGAGSCGWSGRRGLAGLSQRSAGGHRTCAPCLTCVVGPSPRAGP